MNMTIEEVWATGIFEGEGCIYINPKKNLSNLIVRSTDLDILERIQKLWGGSIHPFKQQANPLVTSVKQCYQWRIYKKKEVRAILEKMLPLLGLRRACKAQDAIDKIDECYLNT